MFQPIGKTLEAFYPLPDHPTIDQPFIIIRNTKTQKVVTLHRTDLKKLD